MNTAEPLLILTDDDRLAAHWQALGHAPVRARRIDALDSWRAAGHRLVLADLALPSAETPIWQRPAWQRNAAGLAILAASSRPNDDEGLAVLNAGASGYCHTHAPGASLGQALEVVASGELWVGRALLSRLLRLVNTRLPRLPADDWSAPLTEREREVAQLAAVGDSNPTIAATLGFV